MPAPRSGESEQDFVNRCVPVRQKEHPDEGQDQSVAICHSVYREAHGKKSADEKIRDGMKK